MPEFVNISVGSFPGTRGLEATTACPLSLKKSRKVWRMSATVNWEAIRGSPCDLGVLGAPAVRREQTLYFRTGTPAYTHWRTPPASTRFLEGNGHMKRMYRD